MTKEDREILAHVLIGCREQINAALRILAKEGELQTEPKHSTQPRRFGRRPPEREEQSDGEGQWETATGA
jgi:hypothetical protein